MAKKFGKLLLLTAAIGTAAAAAYYYMQKKDSAADIPEDEDYDDFSEDLDENPEASRNYVALNTDTDAKAEAPAEENAEEKETEEEKKEKNASFTPLSEQVKETEESVEKFFDEEDSGEDNAPVGDN